MENKIIARRKGYVLHSNGELWTTGKHGYLAGHVIEPGNLDNAIDNHEEEVRVMMAQARAEFGF